MAFELLRLVRVYRIEERLRFILYLSHAHAVHALRVLFAVGGMRASIYNAVPEAAVDALVDFMGVFERENG